MTKLDEVARAIAAEFRAPLADAEYRMALAAIEAMLVPTAQMVNAAWYDYEGSPHGVLVEESSVGHASSPDNLSSDTAYEVWQAMIDAALNEKP